MLKAYYDRIKKKLLSYSSSTDKKGVSCWSWGVLSYHISCWLKSFLSFLYCCLCKLFFHFRRWFRFLYRLNWWQFLFSRSDFLLSVRPKPWGIFRKNSQNSRYFPPPGYGIPPGHKGLLGSGFYTPKNEYGVYLYPAKLQILFFLFSVFLPLSLFLPLLREGQSGSYWGMMFVYWLLSFSMYYFLFNKLMPVSLDNVWKKWPIPAYELFLSVPHTVHVSRSDRYTKEKKVYKKVRRHIFWNPDVQRPMYRQSTEHSPDMQSLQELILNLALFEFLFHKKKPTNDFSKDNVQQKNSITRAMETLREERWFIYLFAPVWINFFLISVSLSAFVMLKTVICAESGDWHVVANFPYNFLFSIFTWVLLTAFYVVKILSSLKQLSKKIREGYFNAQLQLIPQQILNELSYIPSHEEIETGMLHLRKIFGWISSVALIGFLAVLEVLSQAYGSSIVFFTFY